MKQTIQSSTELKDLATSFMRFARKTIGWWYLLVIMLLLFGVVHVYNAFNNRTQTPLENYKEEFIQLQEKVTEQDKKINQLEEQIRLLQEQVSR